VGELVCVIVLVSDGVKVGDGVFEGNGVKVMDGVKDGDWVFDGDLESIGVEAKDSVVCEIVSSFSVG